MRELDFTSDYEDTANALLESTSSGHPSSFIAVLVSGLRYVVYRLTSFYLKTPLKLFRPARFDALFYLRLMEAQKLALRQNTQKITIPRTKTAAIRNALYNSSLGILIRSLRQHGWKILPQAVAPPFLANSVSGVVLYTSYLTFLPSPFFQSTTSEIKILPKDAFCSGALAGFMQAIVSQPIEAVYQRSTVSEFLSLTRMHQSLWKFGFDKLKQAGFLGVFYGGFSLSILKESLGFAVYFGSFEYLKYNGYDLLLPTKNHKETTLPSNQNEQKDPTSSTTVRDLSMRSEPRPGYLNRKTLQTFNAGVSAAFFLQVIQFPINKILKVHVSNLQMQSELNFNILTKSLKHNWSIYSSSYINTFKNIKALYTKEKCTFAAWSYKGFWRNTLAIIPGTTASLLALEYLRNYTRTQSLDHGELKKMTS